LNQKYELRKNLLYSLDHVFDDLMHGDVEGPLPTAVQNLHATFYYSV